MKTRAFFVPSLLAIVVGVGLVSFSALGDPVYSSGMPQLAPTNSLLGPSPGFDLGDVIYQADFTLTNNSLLGSADVWTVDTADGSPGNFLALEYWFYSGDSCPTILVASGFGTNLLDEQYASYDTDDESDYNTVNIQSFDLETNVYLSAGVHYWFVWTAELDPSGVDNWAWWDPIVGDTGTPATTRYAFDFFGTAPATNTSTFVPMILQYRADGAVCLQAQGTPGESLQIEASQDLQTWLNLGSIVADTNGIAHFTDTNAPNYSARFYAVKPSI